MRVWGAKETAAIIRRYQDGETAGMIAATLPGVTRNQIIGLMWRNGVKHVKPYPTGGASPLNHTPAPCEPSADVQNTAT